MGTRLGLRRALLAGTILFALGLALVGFRDISCFYLGLGLLCAGNGLSRPSISLLVGNLYRNERGKLDDGCNILFVFINTGAFIAFLAASTVRTRISWQWVFWTGAIALVVALLVLIATWTSLETGDFPDPKDRKQRGALAEFCLKLLLPAVTFGGIGYLLSLAVKSAHLPSVETAVVCGMLIVIAFFVTLPWRVSNEERPIVVALLMVFLAATTFFAVLHMHGSALTMWAKDRTNREVPWVPDIWTQDAEPSYFQNSAAQVASPNQQTSSDPVRGAPRPRVINPEVYQSLNPFWVIVLTPIVLAFFGKRESSGKPVSTSRKMLYGLLLTAMSMCLMEVGAWVYELHQTRVSGLWLVGTYCIITAGEVCLTPMGQSLVLKLAPARLAGVLMGGWFCAMAIGNEFSGLLGELQNALPPRVFFLVLTIVVSAVAVLFWKVLPRLEQAIS